MKRRKNAVGVLLLVGLVMLGGWDASSGAVDGRSRFQRIAERNPFRLRPALVAVVKPLSDPVPVREAVIEITGLTDVAGIPRALAEIRLPDERMLRPVLSTGDWIEGIEVTDIDVRNGTVTTRVRGNESRVTLRPGGRQQR